MRKAPSYWLQALQALRPGAPHWGAGAVVPAPTPLGLTERLKPNLSWDPATCLSPSGGSRHSLAPQRPSKRCPAPTSTGVAVPAEPPGGWAITLAGTVQPRPARAGGPSGQGTVGKGDPIWDPLPAQIVFGPVSAKFPTGVQHHASSTRPFHGELYSWAYYRYAKDLSRHTA